MVRRPEHQQRTATKTMKKKCRDSRRGRLRCGGGDGGGGGGGGGKAQGGTDVVPTNFTRTPFTTVYTIAALVLYLHEYILYVTLITVYWRAVCSSQCPC